MRFNISVNFDGKRLRVTVPPVLKNHRFEAYYDRENNLFLESSQRGLKVITSKGHNDKDHCFMVFSKKWVEGMPKVRFKKEVDFQIEKKIRIPLPAPEQVVNKPLVVQNKPTLSGGTETARKCISFLNEFSKKEGYEFLVKDGKLSLHRTEIIS